MQSSSGQLGRDASYSFIWDTSYRANNQKKSSGFDQMKKIKKMQGSFLQEKKFKSVEAARKKEKVMGLIIYQKIFTKTALSKIFRHQARWQKFLDSAVLVKIFW